MDAASRKGSGLHRQQADLEGRALRYRGHGKNGGAGGGGSAGNKSTPGGFNGMASSRVSAVLMRPEFLDAVRAGGIQSQCFGEANPCSRAAIRVARLRQ